MGVIASKEMSVIHMATALFDTSTPWAQLSFANFHDSMTHVKIKKIKKKAVNFTNFEMNLFLKLNFTAFFLINFNLLQILKM